MGLEGFRTIKWGPYDIAIDSDALKFKLYQVPTGMVARFVRARISAKTAVTKADTNYNTFALKNGSVTLASVANGPNSAAGTSIPVGTSASADFANGTGVMYLAAGEMITLVTTKTGNGLAVAGAEIEVDITLERAAT